jgi:RNA polymerase sigma-70 factor (ECF subfamily)
MDDRRITGPKPLRRGQGLKELLSVSDPSPLSAEQVYHDYAPRVFNVARRMVATDCDAEDVTQEVLLQVVRKLPTFRGDAAFPTWLHRVTVNTALTHRRRQATRQDHVRTTGGNDQPLEIPGGEGPPEGVVLGAETRHLLDEAIRSLPEAYREVFLLADIEGLPNAEVADRLELTLAAVKSRLHRARAMLREALEPHFGDVPS